MEIYYRGEGGNFKHPADCVCVWCDYVRNTYREIFDIKASKSDSKPKDHYYEDIIPEENNTLSMCMCTGDHVCTFCQRGKEWTDAERMQAMKDAQRTQDNDSDNIRDDMAASDSTKQGIFQWRKQGFRQLGFSDAEARELANTKIELAAARNLHRDGCPPELIKRILWGTSFMGEEDDWIG